MGLTSLPSPARWPGAEATSLFDLSGRTARVTGQTLVVDGGTTMSDGA